MQDQITHYENKLKHEIDSYDLWESITLGKDVIVVDARSEEAYTERHIPRCCQYTSSDHGSRNHGPPGQKHTLRYLLRWDRLQRVDQRRVKHGQARFQREGTYGRTGLVDAGWLRNRRPASHRRQGAGLWLRKITKNG